MKKILLSAAGILISITGFSQEAASSNSMTALYALGALVFVVLLLVIMVAILLLRSFNTLVEQTLKHKAKALGVAYVPEPSFWTKLFEKLNAAVPVEQEKDIDLGHSYDGIRELDNHLPRGGSGCSMQQSCGLLFTWWCTMFHRAFRCPW
jgi:cytochrome c oxidase cbb3-type subunit 3